MSNGSGRRLMAKTEGALNPAEQAAANDAVQVRLASMRAAMGACVDPDSLLAVQQADGWWQQAINPDTTSMGSFVNAITPKIADVATEGVNIAYLVEVLNQRLKRLET